MNDIPNIFTFNSRCLPPPTETVNRHPHPCKHSDCQLNQDRNPTSATPSKPSAEFPLSPSSSKLPYTRSDYSHSEDDSDDDHDTRFDANSRLKCEPSSPDLLNSLLLIRYCPIPVPIPSHSRGRDVRRTTRPGTHNVHHHRHGNSFNRKIPSRDAPAAARDLRPLDLPPQSTETPFTISAILNGEVEKPQKCLPPPSLKQAGDLVGIFNDERGALFFIPSSPTIWYRIVIIALARKDIHSQQDDSPQPSEPSEGDLTNSSSLANEAVISQVKEIIEKRDKSSLRNYLRGEVAQTFVDVMHEVRLHIRPLSKSWADYHPLSLSISLVIPIRPWIFPPFVLNYGRSA